jgi:tetratricopeptide (TPR) repeat protein
VIDPNRENLADTSSRLSAFGDRVELIHGALGAPANISGESEPISADHSAFVLANDSLQQTTALTIDHICAARRIAELGVFRMCVRGTAFEVLKGAEAMLASGAIRFLVVRVGFAHLAGEVPEFGAVAEYLRRFGYEVQGIHEGYRGQSIVLRGAEVSFIAPQLQVPQPVFSLSAPNESFATIEGRRLADSFLRDARVQEGAAIRAQSSEGQHSLRSDRWPQVPTETAWIMNAIIDTTPEPDKYSLQFSTDDGIRRQFKAGELVVAEVAIKVAVGKVGIAWTRHNGQPLHDRERYVSEMPEVQRVLVSAPAKDVKGFVFRNVADTTTKATFKVLAIRTKIVSSSVRRALHDSGAETLYLAGYAAERAGKREEAARLFAEASTLVPDHAPALEGQGEMLDAMGKPDLARAKYDAARKQRTESRERAPDRCLVLRRRGRFTDQIAAFNSVLHSVRDRTLPFIARGNAFLAEGRAEAALLDYESALQLKPSPEVAALKGEALSMLGRYQEALEAFDFAVARHPEDPDVLSGRAIALLGVGKLEAADNDWRRQLKLLPATRILARACVALRLADYEMALPELEHTLAQGATDAYWRLYHLTALHRLGRPYPSIDATETEAWPSPLLALHAGRLSEDDVLRKADNDERRVEALFQLGVIAFHKNREEALRRWAAVVDRSRPDLIEYAAARHELARIRS